MIAIYNKESDQPLWIRQCRCLPTLIPGNLSMFDMRFLVIGFVFVCNGRAWGQGPVAHHQTKPPERPDMISGRGEYELLRTLPNLNKAKTNPLSRALHERRALNNRSKEIQSSKRMHFLAVPRPPQSRKALRRNR